MPPLTADVLLGMVLIFVARLVDVSLGTLRTMAVFQGRRFTAWGLGFCEVLVWVLAVSHVVTGVREQPILAVAYALGFATGNFLGITIERWIARGEQVVRVFTRRGEETAARLRAHGYGVTEFTGKGRDGPVTMLFVEVKRRRSSEVASIARQMDPECYYVVDDVRLSSSVAREIIVPSSVLGGSDTAVQTSSAATSARK
jgi:uncharacterized protein YebE (UPF0316 family)